MRRQAILRKAKQDPACRRKVIASLQKTSAEKLLRDEVVLVRQKYVAFMLRHLTKIFKKAGWILTSKIGSGVWNFQATPVTGGAPIKGSIFFAGRDSNKFFQMHGTWGVNGLGPIPTFFYTPLEAAQKFFEECSLYLRR